MTENPSTKGDIRLVERWSTAWHAENGQGRAVRLNRTSNRSRDESGRFAEQGSDREVLELFDRSDEPFSIAPEIAERSDATPQAITYRLKRTRDEGLVDRKNAGSNAVG